MGKRAIFGHNIMIILATYMNIFELNQLYQVTKFKLVYYFICTSKLHIACDVLECIDRFMLNCLS